MDTQLVPARTLDARRLMRAARIKREGRRK
jgi:hypothetical protein